MDLIGTAMGFVTIPMALFTVASALAGFVLLATGATHAVIVGVVGFLGTLVIAFLVEQLVIMLDERAISIRRRLDPRRARMMAAVAGVLPMLALLGCEWLAFRTIMAEHVAAPASVLWLWSYGVATGPWTAFALRAGRDRRTLCSIRAYAGHLAYWLFSVLVLVVGTAPALAALAMLLPSILPITVGCLLAVANRDSLHNVRI